MLISNSPGENVWLRAVKLVFSEFMFNSNIPQSTNVSSLKSPVFRQLAIQFTCCAREGIVSFLISSPLTKVNRNQTILSKVKAAAARIVCSAR
jgi:hypothetical protein